MAPEYATAGGYLSPYHVRALKEWGATFAIVKAANPFEADFANRQRMCRQHILVLAEGGLEVSVYCYLYFSLNILLQVAEAIRTVQYAASLGITIPTIWLDVEDDTRWFPYSAIITKIQEAVTACAIANVGVGIYTSSSKWRQLTGDTSLFAQLALWDARYGHQDPSDFLRTPYGGWLTCAIRQYQGSTDIGGVNVDLNSRWRADA